MNSTELETPNSGREKSNVSSSDEPTHRDTLRSILVACERSCAASEAARDAAEKAAAVALQKVQEKHDLVGVIQGLLFRVDRLELVRLPLRAPWLALAMCTLNMIATLLLAWKVFR